MKSVRNIYNTRPISSYIAYIKDEISRYNSTSGGLFYALARNYILQGGIVYGVAFDKKYATCHIRVDDLNKLKQLQGSKYPQSNLNGIFKIVEKDLQNNYKVIFSGTPCQIAGLKSYLNKNYENLLSIDLICHGVPSPGIWRKYLDFYFNLIKIKKITFKDKSNGWKLWKVRIESENSIYEKERTDDMYMASYINEWNIRPSCYNCQFKGIKGRCSDITIADAWGNAENDLSINDNKGLSCVILNTKKGAHEFELIKEKLIYKNYSYEDIISGNPAYSVSVKSHFLKRMLIKHTFANIKLIEIFSNDKIIGRVISKINRFIKRRK